MFKKLLRILSILCICTAFLAGCMSEVARLQKYDPNINYTAEYATLVVSIRDFDYLDISRVDRINENEPVATEPVVNSDNVRMFDLKKLLPTRESNVLTLKQANDYRIIKASRWAIPNTYAQSVYTIPAGIYYISYIASETGEQVYYSKAPGLNAENIIAYGAFEIKPGEVLYLGDIECRWRTNTQINKILVKDNLSDVKKDLSAAGFANIANKIKHAQFYQRGSKVSLNKEGKYSLHLPSSRPNPEGE